MRSLLSGSPVSPRLGSAWPCPAGEKGVQVRERGAGGREREGGREHKTEAHRSSGKVGQ